MPKQYQQSIILLENQPNSEMRKVKIMTKQLLLVGIVLAAFPLAGDAEETVTADKIEQGKALAFERSKGNCLACHLIEGGELTGNYGPPLLMMKARFPDRSVLRAQIWDAGVRMSSTRMPPYGRHRILTEEEIDLVVDYILTL
jgi:sulfur-oxidizing protein SoxX